MPTYRRVPVADCIVDPRYQRVLDERHPALTDDFDPALLGALEGSQRDSGEVAIFDGQHRLMRLRRDEANTAPVMVHQGLSPQQEADLFRRLQEGRKALSQVETFRARLFAEDPVAVSINGIAQAKGFTIGAGPGSIQAIVALERVFNRGNLEETLTFLKLWDGEKRALEAGMIDGLSRFLDLFPDAERARVKEILSDTSPTVIWRRTVEVMEVARSSRARAVLEVIRAHVSSRKHPLPTVAKAMEARVESTRTGRGRMRRLTLEQVRDAARELGTFYPEQLAEKLGISKRSLTKQGGYLEQLIDRSVPAIAKHRVGTTGQGGGGRYYYEYLRPVQGGVRNRVKAPPPEVMAAQRANANGSVPQGAVPRVSDSKVQEVVNEVFALGVRMEQGGSHLKVYPPNGSKVISISKSSTGGRTKTLRGKLRRAGVNVKR